MLDQFVVKARCQSCPIRSECRSANRLVVLVPDSMMGHRSWIRSLGSQCDRGHRGGHETCCENESTNLLQQHFDTSNLTIGATAVPSVARFSLGVEVACASLIYRLRRKTFDLLGLPSAFKTHCARPVSTKWCVNPTWFILALSLRV